MRIGGGLLELRCVLCCVVSVCSNMLSLQVQVTEGERVGEGEVT